MRKGRGLLLLFSLVGLVGVYCFNPLRVEPQPLTGSTSTPHELPTTRLPSSQTTPVATTTTVARPEPTFRRTVYPAQGESIARLRERLLEQSATVLGWGGEGYDVLVTQEGLDALVAGGSSITATPLPITARFRQALEENPEVEATLVFTTLDRAEAIAQRFDGIALRDAVTFRASSAEVREVLETAPDLLAGDIVCAVEPYNAEARSKNFLGADVLQLNQTRLMGKGEIVAVMDTGCSAGSTNWETGAHPGLKNQVLRFAPLPWVGMPNDGQDSNGHGTHVCGSIVGDGSGSLNNNYRGVAPEAKLIVQGAGNLSLVPQLLDCAFDDVYANGARIHSNSWGATEDRTVTRQEPPIYGLMMWSLDRYTWSHQDFLPIFAAGNSGTDIDNDGIPDLMSLFGHTTTAKNALVVGASTSTTPAKVWSYSCTGPLYDGRIKPDVITPGVDIMSTTKSGSYMTSSGTSMAAPLTAGACAVIRQYCREELSEELAGVAPSSPLIRALLISGCESVYGEAPNGREGFGLTSLTRALTPETGKPTVAQFAYTGSTDKTWTISVAEEGRLRATLVWLDYPAELYAMKGIVNDLDLEIAAPDGSVTTLDDHVNVIERIDLSVTSGTYTVRVRAHTVPMPNGVAALVVQAPVSPKRETITFEPEEIPTGTKTLTVVTKSGSMVVRRETLQVLPGKTVAVTAETVYGAVRSNERAKGATYTPSAWSLSTGASGEGTTATFTMPDSDCTLTWSADSTETTLYTVSLSGATTWVQSGSTYTLPMLEPQHYWYKGGYAHRYTPGMPISVTQDLYLSQGYWDFTNSDSDGDGYTDEEEFEDATDWEDANSVPTPPVIVVLEDPPVRTIESYDTDAEYLIAMNAYDNCIVADVLVQTRPKGTTEWKSYNRSHLNYVWMEPCARLTEYRVGVTDALGEKHRVWSETYTAETLVPEIQATYANKRLTLTNTGTKDLTAKIVQKVHGIAYANASARTVTLAPGETATYDLDFGSYRASVCSVVVTSNDPFQPTLTLKHIPGYLFRIR